MQSFWFFEPMVVACAVVLLPLICWMGGGATAFRAHAQMAVCAPSQNQIIQVCDNDLAQFDSDSVQAYLAAHSLPATDSSTMFQYARTDLRNELRAFEFARLLDIVQRAPSQRTSHEQAIYNAFQSRVWQHEKDQYQAAVNDRNSWKSGPCAWSPDGDVAKAYALVYDPAPFCVPQPFGAVYTAAPLAPGQTYFLAGAQKNTYGKTLAGATGGPAIAADTGAKLLIALGYAAIPTVVPAAGMSTTIGLASAGFIPLFPFGLGAASAATPMLTSNFAALPLEMVMLAQTTSGMAAFEAFQGQPTLDHLAPLDNLNAYVAANPPDLSTYSKNQPGLYKLLATFAEMTVPESASAATLPSHRTSDANFVVQLAGQAATQETTQVAYTDWNGAHWMASTYGGWLVQTCFSANCTQSGTFSPTMNIVDWSGTKWTASRVGANFLLTKQSPASTDQACPVNALTGLSSPADSTKCSSLVTSNLQYFDAYGKNVAAHLTRAPVFTSPPTAAFTTVSDATFTTGFGKRRTFAIAATGDPLPAITLASGTLPAGINFTSSQVAGPGNATLDNLGPGIPPNGVYNITLQAQNSAGTVTQAFTVIVGTMLQITSPAVANFTYGLPGSFTVTASGPAPIQYTYDPRILPAGLTFQDNGDGTATISGTPLDGSPPPPCTPIAGGPCGVTASDSVTSAFQALQITLRYPPRPVVTSANAVTFVAGRPNSFLITASGATSPLDITMPCGAPSWLNLQDNHDGTAVLSGTPPIDRSVPVGVPPTDPSVPTGTLTNTRLFVRVHTSGSGDHWYRYPAACALTRSTPNFTLSLVSVPMFTSSDLATFTAGQTGAATVTTTDIFIGGPQFSYMGLLPAGTSFTPANWGGTIAGTPALSALPPGGAGGDYPVSFAATGLGASMGGNAYTWTPITATQLFDLRVNQPPAIISATDANFTIGVPNTFTFVTTGFPQLPSGGQPGMSISYTGALPAGTALAEVKPLRISTGVFALSGTPTGSAGPYSIMLTASNGVGTAAKQTFTVHVIKPGDVNGDGQVNCSDINVVKAAMGTWRDHVGYDYRADANNDGVVDANDLAYVTSKLPPGTTCQ
jgi:hypothetical protein